MPEENTSPAAPEGSVRINKYLALCGFESRRAADKIIEEGRVEVNGQRVETPGVRVQPTDFVKVDGHRVTPKAVEAVLLNKPRGFVCSRKAQGADGTVYDLLPPKYSHLNYAGRLDADSEGLLVFTNNGVLMQNIPHPSAGVEKEYWVTLDQAFDASVLVQLLKGLRLPEGQARAKYVSRLSARRACVVLEQGLKRQVRQMFGCLGLRVKKLVRVRIGSLWGGDLEPGHCALLTEEQVAMLTTNPPRRKGLVGAKQVFKPRTETAGNTPAPQDDADENYDFNPADFETEEEALESSTKYAEGESLEPERPLRGPRPFGRVPHAPRQQRGFGDRREQRGGFRGGRRDDHGQRGGFRPRGGERNFGNRRFQRRDEDNGGERRPFGPRRFERRDDDNGERRGFGERRNFGERQGFGQRRNFGDRKPGGNRRFNRNDGERRGGFGNNRRGFGGHGNQGGHGGHGGGRPFHRRGE